MITEEALKEILGKIAALEAGADPITAHSDAIKLNRIGDALLDLVRGAEIAAALVQLSDRQQKSAEELKLTNEKLQKSLQRYEEVSGKIDDLENRHRLLMGKKEKLSRLQELQAALKEAEPGRLEKEISETEQLNSALLSTWVERLRSVSQLLEDANSDIGRGVVDQIAIAEDNLLLLRAGQDDALKVLSVEPLKEAAGWLARKIDTLVNDYNDHVEKIERIRAELEIIQDKHDAVMENFKAHQLENTAIYGALSEKDSGVQHYVERLGREIAVSLAAYDRQIKDLVDKRHLLPIYQLERARQ